MKHHFFAFWKKKMQTEKAMMSISLFLIGALHTMIFAFFEYPSDVLLQEERGAIATAAKIFLYSCAIISSLGHQVFCKNLGLKKSLILGLALNLAGLLILWLNRLVGIHVSLLFLEMLFFGAALPSVLNSLITYLVIEFPKHLGAAILAISIFFNLGSMLAPLAIHLFQHWEIPFAIFPTLIFLIILAMWHIWRSFFEPTYPSHLKHLRKGTLIWKELHYRLGLFVLAITCYGFTENTFNLWGFVKVAASYGSEVAEGVVSLFWLFIVIGQIILLSFFYFRPTRGIFYVLILIAMAGLYYFSLARTLPELTFALILGGVGCSTLFPNLISLVEREFSHLAKESFLLPYIETSISVLLAGYFFGVGTIDLWVGSVGKAADLPFADYFYLSMGAIGLTGVIAGYLAITGPFRR